MWRGTLAVLLLVAACTQRKTAPTSEPAIATTNERGRATTGGRASTEDASARAASSGFSTSNTANVAVSSELGLGEALVHVPSGLPPGEKAPLVVILHGLGASSAAIDGYSDFPRFAEAQRIAWVAPDGPKDGAGRRFWNAGSVCCNFDGISVDHVAALRTLITRTIASKPVDPKRVFVVGYSNGGFMAHRLGCELGGLVAGIVSVAGAGVNSEEPCPNEGPLRVLQVHGDADKVVNIAGGPLFSDPKYPVSLAAARTVSDWGKRLGCEPTPKPAGSIDFESRLPGAETRVTRFEGCRRGAVEFWTVSGGGHYIGLSAPSYEAMWKFLSGP